MLGLDHAIHAFDSLTICLVRYILNSDVNAMTLGRELLDRRRKAGLSQAELAARVRTSQAAISRIETGRTLPGLPLLERIALATGGPLQLVLGSPAKSPSRAERRRRVRRVLGRYEFNPWDRNPTPAEAESLIADGLTPERFQSRGAARTVGRREEPA